MVDFVFGDPATPAKINLAGGDRLLFNLGVSAADVSFSEKPGGVEFVAGGSRILVRGWVIPNINSAMIGFADGTVLRVGDDNIPVAADNGANAQASLNDGGQLDDQFHGLGGNDTIDAGSGNDLAFGHGGDDTMAGDAGEDELWGAGGDDTITGGDEADKIDGGRGNDTVSGDGGDDRIVASSIDSGSDTVTGGDGNDRIDYGNAGRTTIQTLSGGDGNDVIIGGSGHDVLEGGDGADRIVGGDGRDLITGGLGADNLRGGTGRDTFVINSADSPAAAGGFDIVRDFRTGADVFDLPVAGTDANYIEEALAGDDFAAAFARAQDLFVANDGVKIYVFISGTTKGWLFGDLAPGDFIPDLAIELDNGGNLDALAFADIL